MADLRSMMAHGKADTKMDKKNDRVRDNLLERFSIDYFLGSYTGNGRNEKLFKGFIF